MNRIPIRNLYYLLSYAWDSLAEAQQSPVTEEDFDSLPDLFARVLRTGVSQLLRVGLDRGYVTVSEPTISPRGKIALEQTLQKLGKLRGQVVCDIDEFHPDLLHNRILKSTLVQLARTNGLDAELRREISSLCHRLHEIPTVTLTKEIFDRVIIRRHNRMYRFLIEVCRLLFAQGLAPNPDGHHSFSDFTGDTIAMAKLFERFIQRFFAREQQEFRVKSHQQFRWKQTSGDVGNLPIMETDLTLSKQDRLIVIDAKYYAECLKGKYDRDKVISPHLYQLFAYLKNLTDDEHEPSRIEGILIYPAVEQAVDLRFTIHGHPVRVITLNLNQPWNAIHQNLLDVTRCD